MTLTVEIPDVLFFLGVEANDRVSNRLKFSFVLSNFGKLLVSMRNKLRTRHLFAFNSPPVSALFFASRPFFEGKSPVVRTLPLAPVSIPQSRFLRTLCWALLLNREY